MCEVVVASLPSTPAPELVDDAGRLHLFFTAITPTSIGGLPTTASSPPMASMVSHLYYAGTILSSDLSWWKPDACEIFLTKVLLVKGLETGSSSGWFVRGIPGARDL
uniref:Uncharacterized protein n=1 Tax=Triticum urartu TaxID=4572 RepID=A0A8R7U920_TRIUA